MEFPSLLFSESLHTRTQEMNGLLKTYRIALQHPLHLLAWAVLASTCLVALLAHAEPENLSESGESFAFKAEVTRVLDILINSLYTDKDVFLRELISNGSDALDRFRFAAIKNPNWVEDDFVPFIHVQGLPATKAVRIQDNGIGMTREEMINDLGRIARSGTTAFLDGESIDEETNLIGMFGVGFYSVFLVAERVDVYSRHPSSPEIWHWSSDGSGSFNISQTTDAEVNTDRERDPLGAHGTRIILQLKPKFGRQYSDEGTLERLLERYSQYINYPLGIWSMIHERLEVEVDEEGHERFKDVHPEDEDYDQLMAGDDDLDDLDLDDFGEDLGEDQLRHDTVMKWDFRRINTQPPIWLRPPRTVTDQEYRDFFASLSGSGEPPASWLHYKAASDSISFRALLYIPRSRPFNVFQDPTSTRGVRLYRQRIFVSENATGLLPEYLTFLQGAIDSHDLPLNVNREVVAESSILTAMRQNIVKRVIRWLDSWSQSTLLLGEDATEAADAAKTAEAETEEEVDEALRNLRKLQEEEWGADAYDPYHPELDEDQAFSDEDQFGSRETLDRSAGRG